MRIVNGVFCVLLLLFAAVQYNDPDSLLWLVIYLVPAAWAGFAAWRPAALRGMAPTLGLALCIAAALVGTVYYWPPQPHFWDPEVFWPQESGETAREGMGMMIATLGLLVVALTRWRWRGRGGAQGAPTHS